MSRDSSPEITPLPAPLPLPEYHMDAGEVERMAINYSDRPPGVFILSGPMGESKLEGRRFPSWERAETWARFKFGARFVGPVQDLVDRPECGRWGFHIRTLSEDGGA